MSTLPEIAITPSLWGDGDDSPAPTEPTPDMSATRRASARRRDAIASGVHPLALVAGRGDRVITMHPSANRGATIDDPRGLPLTCGTCVHRRSRDGWAKCQLGPQSRGTGTDVRAWWPGCTSYEGGGS